MLETQRYRLSGDVGGTERQLALPPGELSVGSGADQDLRLPVAGVSRRHARLTVAGGDEAIRVADLGSKNGTFVAGRRARADAALAPGEVVEFGPVRLRLELVDADDVDLGLDLGLDDSERAARPDSAVTASGRTVSLERRDPRTALLVETVDRLWREATGDLELADFARRTFAADAAALLEWRGDRPSVLAFAGDGAGDVLGEATLTWPGPPGDGEAGFSFFDAGDDGRACGRLHLDGRTVDLALWRAAGHPSTMATLTHLALLWMTRTAANEAAPAPRDDSPLRFPAGHVVGESPAMVELYGQVAKAATGDMPVLLLGETGVGKEHVARLLHLASARRDGPLVAVNCAAIPAELLEAELFGITGGVATGVKARRGKLEAANGGTLLLDEIGDMPPALQVKLLRVLQERTVEPLGGTAVELDLRVVAATHADLPARVAAGAFRQDLYYRLAGFELRIPPLRERRGDIPRLIEAFARRALEDTGKRLRGVTVKALGALIDHPWPGNVRQLEHEVRRLVYLSGDGRAVEWADLSEGIRQPSTAPPLGDSPPGGDVESGVDDEHGGLVPRLERLERRLITAALEACGGNQTRAARRLEISRNGLIQRMKRLGVPTSTGR